MTTRERIKEAVDDPFWRTFRNSLKGLPTEEKLDALRVYFTYHTDAKHLQHDMADVNLTECDICIQVDNYIKALCRGGQLLKGASLVVMLDTDWSKDWIKR